MKHLTPDTMMTSGLRYLGIFLFAFFCQQSSATISGIELTCSNPDDPQTCTVASIGNNPSAIPSTKMIGFVSRLINSAIDPNTPNPDCNLTIQGGTCSIGGETPVNMGCNYSVINKTVTCGLTDYKGEINEAITIGCNGDTKSCSIITDSSKFADLLPPDVVDALSPNIASLANSLLSCASQNTFGNFSEICNNVLSMVQNGNIPQAIDTIRSLQPLNPDASADIIATNLRQSFNTIQERLSRLRSGTTLADNVQTRQYFAGQEWHEAGTLLAQSDSMATDANSNVSAERNISEYGRLGVFINMAMIDAEQEGDVELQSDSDSQILTMGMDYRFSDRVIGGLAFNINQSETGFDGSNDTTGELESDGYSVLLYSSFYHNDWFLDASLTMGGDNYEQLREPALLGNGYEASFHGDQQSFSLSTGHDFHIRSFNITPFAQLTKGSVTIDSYRETATNSSGPNTGATLELDEQDKDIGSLNIGSHFRWILNTGAGVFIPVASITLAKDLEDEAQVVTGRFIGNTTLGGGFQLKTNEVDTSYMVLGLGFSFQLKNGNAGFLNLETIEGYDNLDQQRITVGWRWEI